MAEVAIIGAGQTTFDFQTKKVEVIDLPTLKKTQKEHYCGVPLRGIYHFDAIERALAICGKHNLDYQIEEVFAAHNNSKQYPGTSVLEQLEVQYGKNAVEAHILRRVFTTIRIRNHETEELTTTLVIAYHQDGIQTAIGPCVKICHNQCIMSPERTASTFGKDKVSVEDIFGVIDGWLSNFHTEMSADRARIERLKNTPVSQQEILTYIGILSAMRVAHDSSDKRLREKVAQYPLNSAQINRFTEDILKKMTDIPNMTAWDVYNTATEYYKPDEYEIPTLIPQNLAFTESLVDFIEGKSLFEEAEYVEVEMVA